jgi:hypothetical protein
MGGIYAYKCTFTILEMTDRQTRPSLGKFPISGISLSGAHSQFYEDMSKIQILSNIFREPLQIVRGYEMTISNLSHLQ